jgi:hypothetical protein
LEQVDKSMTPETELDDFMGWLFRDGGLEPPRREYDEVRERLARLAQPAAPETEACWSCHRPYADEAEMYCGWCGAKADPAQPAAPETERLAKALEDEYGDDVHVDYMASAERILADIAVRPAAPETDPEMQRARLALVLRSLGYSDEQVSAWGDGTGDFSPSALQPAAPNHEPEHWPHQSGSGRWCIACNPVEKGKRERATQKQLRRPHDSDDPADNHWGEDDRR